MRVVSSIRERLPDATVSGDFIVGCPGESDEAFEKTLALMDAVVFGVHDRRVLPETRDAHGPLGRRVRCV